MLELLNATAFTVAEEGINQLLQRDPVTLQRLAELDGKSLEIRLSLPPLSVFILPCATGVHLHAQIADEADVVLSGGPADFTQLLTAADSSEALFGKGISIAGDSGLANRFQSILKDSMIDWEGALGDLIGDLPAHQLASFFNWKADSYKRTGSSLVHNLEEYVTEEARLLPTRPEAEKFLRDVDQLREQADRLQARIEQLSQKV